MTRNLLLFASFAALALSGARDARAQQWERTNMQRYDPIYSLYSDGNTLYAGGAGYVYHSPDHGNTWIPADSILAGTDLGIQTFCGIGDTVFAGGSRVGIFRSTNQGVTWQTVYKSIWPVRAIAVCERTLFASVTNVGLLQSTDMGNHWSLTGFSNQYYIIIAAIAINGSTIFCGANTGVYRSSDNGSHWDTLKSGLTDTNIICLSISGSAIFAGTYHGVFRSTDNGNNWYAVNNGLTTPYIHSLVAVDSYLLAGTYPKGVFISTDQGSSWNKYNNGMPKVTQGLDVESFAVDSQFLYNAEIVMDSVWRMPLSLIPPLPPPTPPTVAYITPDAGAPGMCVAVEILAPTSASANYFGFDGTPYPDSLVRFVNPGDSVFMKLGPAFVSWGGKVIQQMLLIEPNATPRTIQLQVAAYGDPQRMSNIFTFAIVNPSHVGLQTGGGDFGGSIPVARSRRNTIVVDSMILNGGTYTFSTSDPDPVAPGNQAYLPVRVLSMGPIRLEGARIDVSGHGGVTGTGGGAGGPGGGGGGSGYPGNGGDGYTGGGGNSDASTSGGAGSGSFSASSNGGGSLTLANGGGGEQHNPSGYDDGGGGSTGHPFGTSGVTGKRGSSDPGAYGAGSGGGSSTDYLTNYGGGGGGYATDGLPGTGSGDNHGMANGNPMLIPLAGGSGGGSGNVTYFSLGGGAGGCGGGGGGAIELTSFTTVVPTGSILAYGGNGSLGKSGLSSAANGGGGSGGAILISARDSIALDVSTSPNWNVNYGAVANPGTTDGQGGYGRLRINGFVSNINYSNITFFDPTSSLCFVGPSIQRVSFTPDSFTVIGYGSQFDAVPSNPLPVTVYWAWPSSTSWNSTTALYLIDPTSHTTKWVTPAMQLSKLPGDTELYAVAIQGSQPLVDPFQSRPAGVMSHTSGIIAKPPPPLGILSVPPLVDFGTVRKGKCKDTSFMAHNTGTGDLAITSETFGDPHFSIVSLASPLTIHPNDSALLTIRYCATDSGNMLSADTVHSNVSNGVVLLKAFTGLGYLQIPKLIDFGEVLVGACRDTPVVVQNIGTDTLVLTGKTNFVAPFSYVGPEPLRLAPNQIDTITLRFCPVDTGVITQADYLDTIGPGERANFVLTGNGIKGDLGVDITPIDFGCVQYDSLVQRRLNLNNHGTASVTGITTSVNPPGALTVTAPDSIGAGSIGTMWISLIPTPGSPSSGTITISTSQGLAATIKFTAHFSTPPALVALDSIVNFDSVNVGDSAEICVRVTNFSCIAIDSVDAALASHNEFTLMNGATSGLSTFRGRRVVADSTVDTFCMMFKPLAAGLIVDTLSVTSYPKPSTPVPIIIKGIGRATYVAVQLAIDTIFGRPGQIVNVPVRTLNDVTTAAITSLTFRVTFDPMQLDLKPNVIPVTSGIARGDGGTNTTLATTYTNKQYSIGDHEITATFATPLTGKAVIAELPFEILVPTANTAPLRLQSATFGSAFATLATKQNGAIVIEQCDTTERIGIGVVPLTVIQNSPNPFTSRTSLRIVVGQPGHLTLRVYNSIGSQIMMPFNADVSTGDQSIELDASALPSGAYRYVTMWSDGVRSVRDEKTMIVVK